MSLIDGFYTLEFVEIINTLLNYCQHVFSVRASIWINNDPNSAESLCYYSLLSTLFRPIIYEWLLYMHKLRYVMSEMKPNYTVTLFISEKFNNLRQSISPPYYWIHFDKILWFVFLLCSLILNLINTNLRFIHVNEIS